MLARLAVLFLMTAGLARGQAQTFVVGAKNFTESSVLAEVLAQVVEERTDLTVERRTNLGGTMICWAALEAGEIDAYVEYTGTGWAVVLGERTPSTDPLRTYLEVQRRCRSEHGVLWLSPLGFENTYALAMPEARAQAFGIRRISDLVAHQDALRGGFSIEFGNREDGLPGLLAAYGLELGSVRTLEHSLAYQAIRSGAIDVMDAYSTDAKLLRYRLRVLEDDRRFFPPYHAVPVLRAATLARHPELEGVLESLAFRIDGATAQALNDLVEGEGYSAAVAARAFLERADLVPASSAGAAANAAVEVLDAMLRDATGASAAERAAPPSARWREALDRLPGWVLQHLALAASAVLLAVLVGVPAGIAMLRRPRWRRVGLGAAGVLQTVPSLALLAVMIPILGLDVKAAIAALFLYALLPILRNTYTGIAEVDPDLVDAARGMGLRPREILTRVQLPLAMRTIMAGVRTATVISIGVAALAAFIGAGGLGEPILEGLYLNDTGLILLGAIPAALLALGADAVLGRAERALQPGGGALAPAAQGRGS